MTAAPPPMETPRISRVRPSRLSQRMSTVLGWATSVVVSQMISTDTPAAFARAKASATRGSSVASPRMPATSALSAPWPDPVAAKEPYRVKTARSGCSPKSFRAMEARAKAPAVCELDGPTMMGPIMSLRP